MHLAGVGIAICLGIQFHYSVITYLLPVFFVLAFYRIKVRPKVLVISLLLIAVCFLPYAIHKKQIHIPNNWGDSVTFKNPEPLDLGKIAKMVFIQNTIERVANVKSFRNGKEHSNNFKKIRWFVLFFCFYFMLIATIFRARAKGIEACKKEIIVLSLFYFPALAYEIAKPFTGHFWYAYIFIVPQMLIVAMTIVSIYQLSQKPTAKVLVSCIGFSYLIYFSHHTVTFAQDFLSDAQKNFKNPIYKNSQTLLRTLMTRLNLTPQEFYERVYLRDLNPESFRQIKFASNKIGKSFTDESSRLEKSCFFIVDPLVQLPIAKQILDLFINDKSLMIRKPFIVSSDTGFGSIEMLVYEYKPILNQACYRNLSNPFITEKSTRDLLIDTKKLIKGPRLPNTTTNPVLKIKTLELKENYNQNSKLVSFQGHYIIYNNHQQLPFRLKLKIREENDRYFLRADIENYYFWKGPNYKLTNFFVFFVNKKVADKKIFWTILDSGKINNTLGPSNLKWFREVELTGGINLAGGDNLTGKVDLTKDEFQITVAWQTFWFEPNYQCCTSKETNSFDLKTFQ